MDFANMKDRQNKIKKTLKQKQQTIANTNFKTDRSSRSRSNSPKGKPNKSKSKNRLSQQFELYANKSPNYKTSSFENRITQQSIDTASINADIEVTQKMMNNKKSNANTPIPNTKAS